MSSPDARLAADRVVVAVARDSYARLLAWLAYQWRDVAAAEDALGTALSKAIVVWSEQGIPDSPEAWLIGVAKRELLQAARHQRLHDSPEVQAVLKMADESAELPSLPDDRLKLLFVCAHPAIDVSIRPALMLQTVLGLNAQVVAQVMLTSPAAMAQRLVRAKQKIRDARLRFEEPASDELPERLHAVLDAIYAVYGLGWDGGAGAEESSAFQAIGMCEEALFLGSLVCQLLPQEPETWGLLALMHFCESRKAAREDVKGCFIPLLEQDTALWNQTEIRLAEQCLRRAADMGSTGPFQLEAAIQSAHCQRLFSGETPWQAIADLYQQLVALAPTVGAQVSCAVACAQAGDSVRAQRMLDTVERANVVNYQPFWVAKGHLARMQGQIAVAREYTMRAAGLTSSPSIRSYLLAQLDAVER
jgi:RNA polymerase sigma-70 factor (ECF subfamily)